MQDQAGYDIEDEPQVEQTTRADRRAQICLTPETYEALENDARQRGIAISRLVRLILVNYYRPGTIKL